MALSPKRKLTLEEVEWICEVIPLHQGIPFDSAESIRNGVVSMIRSQLETVLIYPENITKLRDIVENEYHASVLQPGEMVGVQAATSIGEPVTQMSLNAFHFSGISTVGIASGVPRVEEIMNASKIQKSYGMTLVLAKPLAIKEIRRLVYHEITEVYLSDIIEELSVSYIPRCSDLPEKDQLWYYLYLTMFSNEIMDEQENFLFPWRIRLVLKRQKLFYHTLSCLDIAQKIESAYRDLYTVASPDNIGIIDIYIDFSQMKLKKKEEEEIVNINHKEDICIRNIIIPFLQDILIAGIPDVEDVYIHEEKGKWVIDTQGSNLSEIFKNPNFDFRHCLSSDIWEIKKILGIEATRQFIINEFYKVLNQSGASIGRRHIELLADSMTFQGKISSVNRYGIDRNETGPLAKASFEESVNNFFIAAVNGEKDQMGVSSSIMAGKTAHMGTGYFDVMLDVEASQKALPMKDPITEYKMKQLLSVPTVPFPTSNSLRTPVPLKTLLTPSITFTPESPTKTVPPPMQFIPPSFPPFSQSTPQQQSMQFSQSTPQQQSMQFSQSTPQQQSMQFSQSTPQQQSFAMQERRQMSAAMNVVSSSMLNLSNVVKPVREYNILPSNRLHAPAPFTKEDGEKPPVSYMNPGHSNHKPLSKPQGKRSKPKEPKEDQPQKISWVKRKPKEASKQVPTSSTVTVQFSDDP